MNKRYPENPNTLERMNQHYEKLSPTKERTNDWMMPLLLDILPSDGSILEVGCGLGKTLDIISEYTSSELHGMELSTIAVDKASDFYPHIAFFVEDASDMNDEEEYDLIINSQTLEHVDDPAIIMENMKRAVKPGGYVFITVPKAYSKLDKGVKLHHWTFFEDDFQKIYGKDVNITYPTASHMVVIYKK